MTNCPILEKCIFFNERMSAKPATVELYKKKYCTKDFTMCARYLKNLENKKAEPVIKFW